MSQNNVSSVILKFTLDEASQRRVLKGVGDVEASLNKTAKGMRSVENVAESLNAEFANLARAKAIDKIEVSAIKAGKKTDDWYTSLKMVSEELSKIGATDSEISRVANAIGNAAAGERGGRRETGSLGRFGREVKALPAIPISGNLSTDAIGKILYTADAGLSALGATAAQVGAASLIAAPAIIGVALAMGEYNKQVELQKAALAGALSAQNRYYLAVTTMTSDQATGEIEAEQARIDALRQQRVETQNAIDSAFAYAQREYGDENARLFFLTNDPTAQLKDQLKELDAGLASSEGYVTRLAQGQAQGVFAANDLTDAEKRLADQRAQAISGQFSAMEQADRMTQQQRQDQITANTRQIQFLQLQGDALADQGLSTDAVNESINKLAEQNYYLGQVTWSLADAKAAEAEASRRSLVATEAILRADAMTTDQREARSTQIQGELEQYRALVANGRLSADATTQVKQKIADLTIELGELGDVTESAADRAAALAAAQKAITEQTDAYFKATEATTKAREALFKAEQDAQTVHDKYIADTLEISRKADEQYQQVIADGGDKRADIVQKSEDQIAKIQRDAGRDLFNAVAERDTLAAQKAKEQAGDQLTDAQKAQSDQVKELEKGQAKQIESLKRSVDQQVRTRDTQYRNEAAQAANASLQAQITLQNRAYAEQAIAANGANGMRSIVSNMWGQLTIESVNGVNAILTATRQLVGGIGGTQMYVNGVNAGSPAAYDLVGLPPPQTTAVNRAVDQRLGTYFNMAGYSR